MKTVAMEINAADQVARMEWEQSFNALPDHICILDKSGKILRANESMRSRFEPLHGPLEGLDYRLVYCGTEDPKPAPPCARVLDGGPAITLETALPAVPGWFVVSSYPLHHTDGTQWGAVSVVKDVTERRRAQLRVDQLFESSIDILCVLTPTGDLKRVNSSFTNSFGPVWDTVQASMLDVVHQDHLDETRQRLRGLQNGVEIRGFKNRCRTTDGSYRWFSWNIPPVLDDTDVTCAVGRDVTQREHEEQLLKVARDQAESADRAKSEFLAIVSHEMRTPLHAIAGALDLVDPSDLSADDQGLLKTCRKASDVLRRLIEDVLDCSGMESGSLRIRPRSFNPADLIRQVVQPFSQQSEFQSLDFHVDVACSTKRLNGDPDRFSQIVSNLLSNALKFTTEGAVTLFLENQDVDECSTNIHVVVRDTGVGIPEDHISQIFNMFAQVDSSSRRQFGGMGLGLWICRHLVDEMRGRIWVNPDYRDGAEFHVLIPFEIANDNSIPKPAAEEPGVGSLRVLIADDDSVGSLITSRMLASLGHSPVCCDNGQKALQLIESGNEFDLIMMDIMMPEVDGIEASEAIRRMSGSARTVPIMAVSAHVTQRDAARCKSAGMQDFLAKPFTIAELSRCLRKNVPDREEYPASVDQMALMERCDNDIELVITLGDLLRQTAESELLILRRAINSNDTDTFRRSTHKLRGTMGQICAPLAVQLVEEIRNAYVHNLEKATSLKQVDNLEAEIDRVCSALDEISGERSNGRG